MIDINRDSKYKDMLPKNIREKIQRKHNLWKRYMETKLEKTYKEYCKVRNKVKNMITYFRKQKEKNISVNIKSNPKAFWSYIKGKTNSKSCIAGLHVSPTDENSGITDNDETKANILNTYFGSVFTVEPDGLPPSLDVRTQKNMTLPIIDKSIVEKYLSNVNPNKSPDIEGYHPKFIKETSSVLCGPLAEIFKSSMETGCIPSQWREARVSAIYKKGNKKLAGNYRPVSITSVICRILEKIIRNHMIEYLCKNDLLSNYQFGFIKGRSTSLQLINILNDWTNSIENDVYTDCIYLDYQKAFDTVPHKRLMSKLTAYNCHSKVNNWIEYYLADRKQYVEINGMKSGWEKVSSGIPQGSVLGPLLFLLYINDLPDNVSSNIYMYADDTKIYREIKSDDDSELLQQDLNKMSEWSETWLLKFHPKKCASISIGKHENKWKYHLLADNMPHAIDTVESIKDIGVTIESNLSFDTHINMKINTANKILGIIRRSYRYLTCESFIPLYKCLVRSYFDYAVTVWDPYKIKIITDIEGVQRRATKLLPELKNLSYPERLTRLKLPTLSYRRARGQMIEVYKIISNTYDKNVTSNLLRFRQNNYVYLRGHNYMLEQRRIQKPVCRNFFSNKVVKVWNNLPNHVVMAESLNIFKNRLDLLWENQDLLTDFRSHIDKKKY